MPFRHPLGLSLLLVVAAGMMPLATVAFTTSENQGHLASRAAEYAQDKLEQLMALSYGDSASDTRVFPATDVGGSGLTIGGSSNPAALVAQYVDYLSVDGALIQSANGAPPQGWPCRQEHACAEPRNHRFASGKAATMAGPSFRVNSPAPSRDR